MYIGKKVQELRKAQRLTLADLAEKSGVQIATLSRMENLRMIGTVESHLQIAKALGVDLPALYNDIIKEETIADMQDISAAADVFVHNSTSSSQILTPKIMSKKMMPVLIKIEPGGTTQPEQNQAGTEKFIFIIEGTVEVTVDATAYTLKKRNTLYFDASKRHVFHNKGASNAQVVCVATPVVL